MYLEGGMNGDGTCMPLVIAGLKAAPWLTRVAENAEWPARRKKDYVMNL